MTFSGAFVKPFRPAFDAGGAAAAVVAPVAGMAAWWKADALALSDGAAVASWTDSSINGFTATQAVAAQQPVYKTSIVNSKPVVRFDGTGDILNSSRVLSDDVFTIFAVAAGAAQVNKALLSQHTGLGDVGRTLFLSTADDGIGAKLRLFFNNGSSRSIVSTGTAFDGSFRLLSSGSDGAGNSELRIAGVQDGTLSGQTWTPLNTETRIGGMGFYPNIGSLFSGDIAEIIIYASVLSAANRQTVEAYLTAKYGL